MIALDWIAFEGTQVVRTEPVESGDEVLPMPKSIGVTIQHGVHGQRQLRQANQAESYFQFVKVEKPAVYSMKKKEIVDRLGNIITEVMPDNEKWRSQSIKDLVVKYKILNKCYEEFGILVPNFQLNEMKSVGDVIKFYTTAKPEDKRTFKSINKKKLPRNLSIGGSLPLKKVSVT